MSVPVQVSVGAGPLVDAVNKFMEMCPGVWTWGQEPSSPRLYIYCRHDSSHKEANERAEQLGMPVVQVYNYAEGAFLTSWTRELHVDWSPVTSRDPIMLLCRIVLEHRWALNRQWV